MATWARGSASPRPWALGPGRPAWDRSQGGWRRLRRAHRLLQRPFSAPPQGGGARRGGPRPGRRWRAGSPSRAGVRAAGRPPASESHQQLSFLTLCSSEALALDRTILRVSFMAMGPRDPSRQPGPGPASHQGGFRLRRGPSLRGGARVVRGGYGEHIGLPVRGGAAQAQWGRLGRRSPQWPRPLPSLAPSPGPAQARCGNAGL